MNQINLALINNLQNLNPSCGPSVVITIDGPAGSGKTTLASDIASQLNDVRVIHMDDLYRGWTNTLSQDLTNLLIEIVNQASLNNVIKYAKFDWGQGATGVVESFKPPRYLIIEGVGAGQRAIEPHVAASIWIEVPIRTGLERVIERDGISVAPFMDEFIRLQTRHFEEEATKKRADYRLSGLAIN